VHILRERIVPGVSSQPGFVAGYWTKDAGRSVNFLLFDSAEAAEHMAADIRGNSENQARSGLRLVSADVTEVVAQAQGQAQSQA
jgi:hypothetical protein